MRRFETETALRNGHPAHFGSVGPDGDPYVLPNLFVCAGTDAFICTWRMRDTSSAMRRRIRGSVSRYSGYAYGEFECDGSASYLSVVGFGAISIVSEESEKVRFFDRFMSKYGDPVWRRLKSFYSRLAKITVYCIEPHQITGKRIGLPPIGEQWPNLNRTKSPGAVPPRRS